MPSSRPTEAVNKPREFASACVWGAFSALSMWVILSLAGWWPGFAHHHETEFLFWLGAAYAGGHYAARTVTTK